jgi:hypothetical protein
LQILAAEAVPRRPMSLSAVLITRVITVVKPVLSGSSRRLSSPADSGVGTLSAMKSANSWLDPAVAFDGWVGVVPGAIISFLTALFVLRKTLMHEHNQFQMQLRQDRQRTLEDRRIEALGDLSSALSNFGTMDNNAATTRAKFPEVQNASNRWALYVPSEHDPVVKAIARALGTVQPEAAQAWKLSSGGVPEYARNQFNTADGMGVITWITSKGRRRHLEIEQRNALAADFEQRFPDVGG